MLGPRIFESDPTQTYVVAQFNRSHVNQFTPFDTPPLYRATRTTCSAQPPYLECTASRPDHPSAETHMRRTTRPRLVAIWLLVAAVSIGPGLATAATTPAAPADANDADSCAKE